MLAVMDTKRDEVHPMPETYTRSDVPARSIERSVYAPAAKNKIFGFAGTCVIFGIAAIGLFVTLEHRFAPVPASAPLVVSLLPLKSPPETPAKPKLAPQPVEKHERQPMPPTIQPTEHPTIPLPTVWTPPSEPAAKALDPAPSHPETAAPRTTPAPPAPQVSSNAPDSWEGRVLARLQKFNHYPGSARDARQQGVAYIRFRINRDGHVLSSALERSSGFPALDQAALDTLRRADPLPTIPADRPNEIELSVPVEYYLK